VLLLLVGLRDLKQLDQYMPIIGAQGIAFEPFEQALAYFRTEQGVFILEYPPHGYDVGGRTVGQICEGPGFDLAVFPVGLAQEDAAMGNLARRRFGQDFCNIHAYNTRDFLSSLQDIFGKYTCLHHAPAQETLLPFSDPYTIRAVEHSVPLPECQAGSSEGDRDPEGNARALQDFLRGVTLLPVDERTCQIFGRERGRLRAAGLLIGDVDLLIGATALQHELTLLTNTRRHFERLDG
jgi:hypothetical protein